MNFLEYCKENNISTSMAAELSEKNDKIYIKARETFDRPAYYGTVSPCNERRDCGEKM